MEFSEKLQEFRKSKGLTQEQLADILYVSRTAVSKWESGRGYPNIDSLKEISKFFSVSVDELLSGEKLLSLAENENKSNIRSICDLLFGIVDFLSFLLIVLPLYPNAVGGYVYSVNLLSYQNAVPTTIFFCWVLFILLIALGIVKIILTKINIKKGSKNLIKISVAVAIFCVVLLMVMRVPYASVFALLLLIIKGGILLKLVKL